MRNKIIIDGNSMGFHHHQCGAVLKAGDQMTQGVFGMLKAIHQIAESRPGCGIVVLWDGRSWRKDECVEYKAKREDTAKQRDQRSTYQSQTPFIKRGLSALGVAQAMAFNLEADDLAAILAPRYAAKGERVWLYTKDRDWLQLVQPGVVWIDHANFKRVSIKTFEEETGYPTREQFSQAKALAGDNSDNLPGVGGIGDVKAKVIMQTWGSVEAFLADPAPVWPASKNMPKAVAEFHALPEKQEVFQRNMRLMNLVTTDHLPAPVDLRIDKGQYDEAKFSRLCAELAFHSILERLPKFLSPFMKPQL